jgi:hypothetical protein
VHCEVRGEHDLGLRLRETVIFVEFHLSEHFDDADLAFVQEGHTLPVDLTIVNDLVAVTVTGVDDGEVALDSHLLHNDGFLDVFSCNFVEVGFHDEVSDAIIKNVIFHLFNNCVEVSTGVKE